ncbi:TetM/TetW/TetO/TetS family tetracycline resistance ribosomal protection protein [Pseudoflavonifractor sp. DSM 107456]|uniref:TetM/TetW/TetO/TetS family tetracycline resistance ribosomal protection protein n=1 Tax=Pseudoflavonifractor gallinarum TaxID=2779352 RepID=A0ABR9R7S5_9FIRM|nr:TetM/TetW/TetO/TetS family tetracycline resistance ribosomal protection protein [Pseudoflavonifractor gallinarum]MBE5054732.1 TetM/TetW/TetO/TetS family tetracycline resistance ribosomal protection protein [Pseudoflavonifractor gallinarum]
MKKLVVGILAHVDAGKTTLSEGMLYVSGAVRKLGRVDHQNAFLDTDALERQRGITIFSKQAVFTLPTVEVTLLDTPGHVDFSSEMERTLQVLDCAILVISGTDGVQGHTQTLWKLLERYHIPTLLFVNKMDLDGADRAGCLAQLRERLHDGCVDFTQEREGETLQEQVAMCEEATLERYLETGTVEDGDIRRLIRERRLFPCWFGSALRLEGVEAFLEGLERYAPIPDYPADFGAQVYKIGRDAQGGRLTYLKVTGGSLKVKDLLSGGTGDAGGEAPWEEKVDQIRIYSGERFQTTDRAEAGTVCAVTGLTHTRAGESLGSARPMQLPMLEPVLTYRLNLPEGADPHTALRRLRELEEEDPQLHILWNESLREIHLQLMGEVQLEILRAIIEERFGLSVTFDTGSILYKETIAAPVEGVGHFEPLRHYAEVHLLLEPGPRGSGMCFATACSEDMLDRNWQRLVLTHLAERVHLGVLTGSPITDMKITLVAGRSHAKHTEGGDFRQATYRAVRQGLMEAESILLEPWYDVRLEVPAAQVGRAMSDLQRRGGTMEPPETVGEYAVLTGRAPVAGMRDYAAEVAAYTRGQGRLFCTLSGYEPCHNAQQVVEEIGYDPERDVEHTPDSVFCTHGAGYVVKWDQVKAQMHVESGLMRREEEPEISESQPRREARYTGSLAEDAELQAIYERTYGKVERDAFRPQPKAPARTSLDESRYNVRTQNRGPEYLLVDGYNIIHAWDELKELARSDLSAARKALMDILSNYQGFRKCEVIVVFDAYKVKGNPGSVSKYHNIHVVYTKEAETADNYIEKVTYELGRKYQVRVATSDGVEQLIILGHGALRVSARMFRMEIEQAEGQIADLIAQNNRKNRKLDQLQYRLGGEQKA